MPRPIPCDKLIEQIQEGDEAAAEQVFRDYSQRLLAVAERNLGRELAKRLDGEDVVQSVFRTFFRRTQEGEFQIDSSSQLWMLLVRITLMKARAKGRFHTAGNRNVHAEAVGGEVVAEVATREPGPEEAVSLLEQVDSMLHGLPGLYGQIVEARLQGHGDAEIAGQLNISRRTIQRALRLMEQRLTQSLEIEQEE